MSTLAVVEKPKVTFWGKGGYGEEDEGFAPVLPDGVQSDAIKHCKEVFARRLFNKAAGGGQGNLVGQGKTIKFLWRGNRYEPKGWSTPEFADHKMKTLHKFEKRMGIEPLATCEVVKNGQKPYLFFEVSAAWKSSIPLAHVLALLVRNHFPIKEDIPAWNRILNYFRDRDLKEYKPDSDDVYDGYLDFHPAIVETMKELIKAGGELRTGAKTKQWNGITHYAEWASPIRKKENAS